MKSSFTKIAVLGALLLSTSFSFSQEICYTIADAGDKLYTLNPSTGAISLIGSTGVGNTESSALNNDGDTLFTANGNEFGWINLSTGTFTKIATIGALQNGPEGYESVVDIDAMTTDQDGTIWAVERDGDGDLIFKINRVTGQPISNAFGTNMDYIQVQSSGSVPERLDAIGIDPTTGILYASANNQSSSADYNYIVTINKTNGVTTSIGKPGVGDIEGLSFTSSGQLIVVTGKSGNDLFYHINKTSAAGTKISTFSTDSDFETCACAGQGGTNSNSITGHAFKDIDKDSILDQTDVLWQNVRINLFEDSDCDSNKDAGSSAIQTVLTDQNGYYKFVVDGVTTGSGTGSASFQINNGDLDVEENNSGNISRSSGDLDIQGSCSPYVGLRFLNMDVPQGATITNAYIEFYADESDGSASSADIYGILLADAQAFTTQTYDLSDRTAKTASIDWDIEDWSTGNKYNSPQLKSIAQELVNQSGWTQNYPMVFIIKHTSGDDRQAESYNGSHSKAPKLVVEYSNGSTTTDCYYIEIDKSTLPSDYTLTTTDYHTASFTGSGESDDNNDFGFYTDSISYECHSISDANDALYSVNPSTGASSFIGYTGASNLEASTLNFNGDTLYSVNGRNFGWVNLTTGDFTKIGTLGTLQNGSVGSDAISDIDAMASGPDNSIYAVERRSGGDLIFKINISTGNYISNAFGTNKDYIQLSTPNGVSNRLDAIGISPLTGVMYASANGQSSSASNNNIITINLSTGAGTLIGNAGVGDLEGMTVTYQGKILVTSGKDGSNTNRLYEINPSTGAATLIGALGGSDFETFTCPGKDPVPVELLSFSGRLLNKDVELNWITASEINNDFFEVQYSADGISYITIGLVGGKGTTQEISNYAYTDYNVLSGTSYYRLKQVDFNGEYEYHGPIVLTQNLVFEGMNVFPNPSNDVINIQLNTSVNHGVQGQVTIYDFQGRVLKTIVLQGSATQIQVSDLPRGFYQIEYKSSTHHHVKPFVIDRT